MRKGGSQVTLATVLMSQIRTASPQGGSRFPLWKSDVATGPAARDVEREPPCPSGQQTKSQRTVKPVVPGPLAMQRTGRNTSRTRSSEALGTCVVC